MGLHKLTAGDGYMYLIRQVAAADATERGRPSLSDYYSTKGESPGVWMGGGLAALGQPVSRDPSDPIVADLWAVAAGSQVSEDQMKALFGEGLHPNADRITKHLTGIGLGQSGALAAARLGRPFAVHDTENQFVTRLRQAYRDYNITVGSGEHDSIAADVRARIRTALGREMFTEKHARPPADDRELSGFIARNSRAATTAVAGYDLTFTPVKSVSALWAIAPTPIARAIEECHRQAVADTLRFLEEHAAFSRMGAHGVAQVNTTGLIAAAFDHRDSRAGDPNLHTHLVISNKVQAIAADGVPRWLALDGTPPAPRHGRGLGVVQHPPRSPDNRETGRRLRRNRGQTRQTAGARNRRHPRRTNREILLTQRGDRPPRGPAGQAIPHHPRA